MRVAFTWLDREVVEIPALVYFEEGQTGISRYEVYVDPTPVFA